MEGKTVEIEGVIHCIAFMPTSGPRVNHGFFIQNLPASSDRDPLTSDGIFVFTGGERTVSQGANTRYEPRVGDIVRLRGTVKESYGQTEIVSPRMLQKVGDVQSIGAELEIGIGGPPSEADEAALFWERREGMLHHLEAGAIAIAGRQSISNDQETYLWVIDPRHPVAHRGDVFSRRVFRDAHPLDDIGDRLFDNGNGHRVLLSSLGLKARGGRREIALPALRTLDTITSPIIGAVAYSYGHYKIVVRDPVTFNRGPEPVGNHPLRPKQRGAVRVATFNVENLYDFRNDPEDGCDFAGDDGCPGIRAPFDYVPGSDAVYRARIRDLANYVISEMGAPDLVLIQEVEDQDFAPRNGIQDVLEDLAVEIARRHRVTYSSLSNRDGADNRGINCAFLFRPDVVEPVDVDLGSVVDGVVGNPAAINPSARRFGGPDQLVFSRAMQLAVFRVRAGDDGPLFVINNHFKSRPDQQVAQRTRQAAANADLAKRIAGRFADARIIVGGDLNVFPRPDRATTQHSEDQLGALYDAGLMNVYDHALAENPASAYSYVYEGQAQTLDHLFVSSNLEAKISQVGYVHGNADWPEEGEIDGRRRISDHDPLVMDLLLAE